MSVFNVNRAWVDGAIRSVLSWDIDLELIVVDDGSTDAELVSWMVGIAAADPRVRYIRQENAGVPSARNTGLEAARGTWLTFFDADDIFVPSERVATALADTSVQLIVCGANGISAIGDREIERYSVDGLVGVTAVELAITMLEIYRYGRVSASFLMGVPWAKFFLTSWLRENSLMRCDPRVLKRSDAEWLLRVFGAHPDVLTIEDEVVAYRFDAAGSNSKGYRPGMLDGYLVLRDRAQSLEGVEDDTRSLYWVELIKDSINAVFSNPAAPASARTRRAYRDFRNQFDVSARLLRDGLLADASVGRKMLYVTIRNRWYLPIVALRVFRSARLALRGRLR